MMKHKLLIPSLFAFSLFAASTTHAGGVATTSGQALNHSAQAVIHTGAAGLKAVSAVTAVPLKAIGAVGEVAGKVGDELWEHSNEPFEISDEVYTNAPAPNKLL